MAVLKKIVGDAAIGRAIRSLNTRLGNINNDVQNIAVAIVEHAADKGNGDMSRSLELCKTVARHRTLNVAYLIGWFRYFASTNINLRANDGAGKVSVMKADAKGYRGFDVEGARANNWFDAFDAKGERSPWYAGPAPADYQPMTIGDIAEDFRRFVKRELDKVEGTKEVNGKVVPIALLSEADKAGLHNALEYIERVANRLARHEDVRKAQEAMAQAEAAANEDEVVQAILVNGEKAVA